MVIDGERQLVGAAGHSRRVMHARAAMLDGFRGASAQANVMCTLRYGRCRDWKWPRVGGQALLQYCCNILKFAK